MSTFACLGGSVQKDVFTPQQALELWGYLSKLVILDVPGALPEA